MRNVLDGDLLKRYFHLGFAERRDLAKQIMSTPEQVFHYYLLANTFTIAYIW